MINVDEIYENANQMLVMIRKLKGFGVNINILCVRLIESILVFHRLVGFSDRG